MPPRADIPPKRALNIIPSYGHTGPTHPEGVPAHGAHDARSGTVRPEGHCPPVAHNLYYVNVRCMRSVLAFRAAESRRAGADWDAGGGLPLIPRSVTICPGGGALPDEYGAYHLDITDLHSPRVHLHVSVALQFADQV